MSEGPGPAKRFRYERPNCTGTPVRPDLLSSDSIDFVKQSFSRKSADAGVKTLDKIGVAVVEYPFPVCILKNVFTEDNILTKVLLEFPTEGLSTKNNDLYQFKQSVDVENLTWKFTATYKVYHAIRTQIHSFLSKIFVNDVLKPDISATFSCYEYKDRLLCHDDKCDDRHVAFVLYLTKDWLKEDGGLLQLFNTDENNYPNEIAESLVPEFNSLVFFEVTPTSFHQVSEILSRKKKRLSLNGWFHCEKKAQENVECVVIPKEITLENNKDFNLENYCLFNYLEFKNQLDIKSMFASDSEIQLDEFLVHSFWEPIVNSFNKPEICWKTVGPANIRKYEVAEYNSLPQPLKTLKDILESRAWFKFLKGTTGLDLSPSATSDLEAWDQGSPPSCTVELRRWSKGSYSLIHDMDPEFHCKALDMFLRVPVLSEFGEEGDDDDLPEAGHVIYIDSESREDECLLHIGYKTNSLALVFRDEKTLRFTKYLDASSHPLFEVACVYRPWCPPADRPELRHCLDDSDSEPSELGSEEAEEEEAEDESS